MEIISDKNIFLDENLKSKDEALQFIAEKAKDLGITTNALAYYKALVSREKEVTTGFGYGVAIPHGKIEEIKFPSIIVVKSKTKIPWQSIDNKPVSLIIALAVPQKDAGTIHLRLLSEIAKKLMYEDFRQKLLHADDKKEIINLLNIK